MLFIHDTIILQDNLKFRLQEDIINDYVLFYRDLSQNLVSYLDAGTLRGLSDLMFL